MKRVRCPKCENYLTFDETKYSERPTTEKKLIYNILGQPLSTPQKGFNIINGEKQIIR